MGIDKSNYYNKKQSRRTYPRSVDPYFRILVKLYKFLARRTNSSFNQEVLKRMLKSKVNKPCVSLSKLKLFMAKKSKDTAVVVGTVTNDDRLLVCPKMSVCALRFTATARARIEKAGGECLSFDQLAIRKPTGSHTVLLKGRTNTREAVKHFGRPAGSPGSHTKPRVKKPTKAGRKYEMARGK